MEQQLRLDLSGTQPKITDAHLQKALAEAAPLLDALKQGLPEYRDALGWLDLAWASEERVAEILSLAGSLRKEADTLVVIGVGGSNQAARAVYEALGKRNGMRLVWAGDTLSAYEMNRVIGEIGEADFCVNVIAKNFETLEPGIAFRTLRTLLRKRYGDAYAKRIVCTGTKGSRLEALAAEHGWHFLPFPADIGGRFSALSPVALFPLAMAGYDLHAYCAGARTMRDRLFSEEYTENIALRYAVLRHLLYEEGFRMEMLSFFEPRLQRFAGWWRQLFAESEGKDGKGLYPLCGNFSEDLHSVGQFVQDGSRVIFETFLDVRESDASCKLPPDGIDDGFSYLDDADYQDINRAALEATFAAHATVFPCLRLTVPRMDESVSGQLFYFFLFACTLSARLLKVNPFDQPGVEAYKERMFRALKKGKE